MYIHYGPWLYDRCSIYRLKQIHESKNHQFYNLPTWFCTFQPRKIELHNRSWSVPVVDSVLGEFRQSPHHSQKIPETWHHRWQHRRLWFSFQTSFFFFDFGICFGICWQASGKNMGQDGGPFKDLLIYPELNFKALPSRSQRLEVQLHQLHCGDIEEEMS